MPLSGKALATAYVVVRADTSAISGDVQKGTSDAVTRGSRAASRKLKDAFVQPVKEGLADGARVAEPGGAAVGGRVRQGIAGKLRGVSADAQKAGADAGAGIERGVSGKMRDVAATTGRGGKDAGRSFSTGAEKSVDEGGKSLVRSVGGAASRMVGAFAAVEIGERSIEFFKGAIEGASDLSEAGNKLQVLFGPAAPKVQEWAAGAATSLGLSKISAEDAAATFGVFAQSAGLAGDQSAQFSEKMTGLAGDLASFHNTSPEQAIEAIGAALRGESEPIRQYGILLDDATLRQRAMKLGIIDTTKNSLTPQQRVLAAQAEILAQTGAAQGDFARTSGGLANQQRILSAQFTNAQAALGEKLLPVMLNVVSFLNSVAIPAFTGVLDVISKIPGPVVAAGAAIVGIGVAARVGKGALEQISATTKIVGQAMEWMGLRTAGAAAAEGAQSAAAEASVGANTAAAGAASRLGTAMGALAGKLALAAGVVGIAAVAVQLEQWSGAATSAKVNSDDLARSLTALGSTGKTTGAALDVFKQGWGPFSQDVHTSGEAIQTFGELAKGAIGGANESWTDWLGRMQSGSERMGRLTSITEQYDASLSKMVQGGSAAQAKAVFDQLADAAQKQGVSVDEIRKLFPQYTAAVTAAGTAAGGATGPANKLAAAQTALGATSTTASVTLGKLVEQYPKYKDVIMASVGAETAAAGSAAQLTAQQVTAAKAAVTHKQALDALTDSLNASNNATLRARGGENAYWAAVDQVTAALKKSSGGLDVHTAKGRENRATLDSMASAGLDVLSSIQKNVGVGPQFNRTLDQQRARLVTAARNFGATRTEANRYADEIFKAPKSYALKVTTPGMDAARSKVQGLHRDINNLSNKAIKITVNSDGTFTQGTRKGAATGGPIPGISPTPTADNIPIAATAGEHMWTVNEVKAAGGHANVKRLRNMAKAGTLPKYAAGGEITVRGQAKVPSAGTLNAVIDADMMAAYRKAVESGGGPSGPVPTGSGVARWGPMVHRALTARGLSQGLWDNWMRQIATESGGNPNAVQGNIGDVNNRSGDLAKGLLQVIGATFRAYHVPGTANNVFDAWANMNAAMNYAKHRYPNMEAVIGHGHGYAAGTRNADPGWNVLGEHGPELVRMRGGEDVRTATETRSILNRPADELVRLHPDTVAQLAGVLGTALARQPIVLDGRTVAGYVDRSMGRSSLSMRG